MWIFGHLFPEVLGELSFRGGFGINFFIPWLGSFVSHFMILVVSFGVFMFFGVVLVFFLGVSFGISGESFAVSITYGFQNGRGLMVLVRVLVVIIFEAWRFFFLRFYLLIGGARPVELRSGGRHFGRHAQDEVHPTEVSPSGAQLEFTFLF